MEQPRWLNILSPVILIAAALLVGALLLRVAGANPWIVYTKMARTAYGDLYGWSDTTIKANSHHSHHRFRHCYEAFIPKP